MYRIIVLISNLILNNNNRCEGPFRGLYKIDNSSWWFKVTSFAFINNSVTICIHNCSSQFLCLEWAMGNFFFIVLSTGKTEKKSPHLSIYSLKRRRFYKLYHTTIMVFFILCLRLNRKYKGHGIRAVVGSGFAHSCDFKWTIQFFVFSSLRCDW